MSALEDRAAAELNEAGGARAKLWVSVLEFEEEEKGDTKLGAVDRKVD